MRLLYLIDDPQLGQKVKFLHDNELIGIVIGYLIRDSGVLIEVSWFTNGNYNSKWFQKYELKVIK